MTSALDAVGTQVCSEDWKSWRDPAVPEYFNPLTYLLDRHVDGGLADKSALIVDGHDFTYRELRDLIMRVDAGLQDLDLQYGARLLMFGTDCIEFVAVWLAAIRRGIIPVAVPDQNKADRLSYFIRDSGASALYLDRAQISKFISVVQNLGSVMKVVILRGDGDRTALDELPGLRVTDFSELSRHTLTSSPAMEMHAEDHSYMLYSGSTTGDPKGIVHLTHDFVLIPERQGAFWEYSSDDVVYATSKKYFTHGLWPGVLMPLYWGATALISSKPVNAANVFETLERYRPTKMITVPAVVTSLLNEAQSTGHVPRTENLNLVITASEKIPEETSVRFSELFGIELMDSIGSSEVTYEWIANRSKEFRRGSLGKPVFGYEVKLIAKSGDEVRAAYAPGEAWVKSVTTCPFYWRKLEKTRAAFRGEWFRTGDVLTFDEDGFFYFVGRQDDLFKTRGLWVSPVEVESAIIAHPDVLEVAVIPQRGTDGMDEPKAFVRLVPGITPSPDLTEAIQAEVRKVGGYKVPREIEYLETLPRTPTGKLDRRALALRNESRISNA